MFLNQYMIYFVNKDRHKVKKITTMQADIASERSRLPTHQRRSDIAEEFGTEEIHINCNDPSALGAGSSAATKLSRFFDKAGVL